MPEWITLNAASHRGAALAPATDYFFAAAQSSCPVSLRELSMLLPFYPLLFARMVGADGSELTPPRYQLVALLSFAEGRNLFVNSAGRWVVPYIPSQFRAHPFMLVRDPDGGSAGSTLPQGMAVAVDASSGCFLAAASDPAHRVLFDEEGQYTHYLKTVERFLAERTRDLITTQRCVDALAAENLIQPLPVQWSPDLATPATRKQGDLQVLHGCYGINEKAFGDLSADAWHALGRSGALGLAYAQVLSMVRIRDLQTRETAWQRSSRPMADGELQALLGGRAAGADNDLDGLFGVDDDVLRFDFD